MHINVQVMAEFKKNNMSNLEEIYSIIRKTHSTTYCNVMLYKYSPLFYRNVLELDVTKTTKNHTAIIFDII